MNLFGQSQYNFYIHNNDKLKLFISDYKVWHLFCQTRMLSLHKAISYCTHLKGI